MKKKLFSFVKAIRRKDENEEEEDIEKVKITFSTFPTSSEFYYQKKIFSTTDSGFPKNNEPSECVQWVSTKKKVLRGL